MIYIYWTLQVLFFLIWIYCFAYIIQNKDGQYKNFAYIGAVFFGLLTFYWNDTIAQLTGKGFI